MYHYNKPKGQSRPAVTPKENHIFGPYFTVQPTNSSVISERVKPNSADVRRDTDTTFGNNANLLRRLTNPNDAHSILTNDKYGNSLASNGVKPRLSNPVNHYSDLSTYNISDHSLSDDVTRAQSAKVSPKHQRSAAMTPVGDHVIFAESSSYPGVPVVYRTVDERNANPDRLNLDRRKLTVCPLLEGEEQLRLLNYQHNFISRISHLNNLRRLIFLDLYDNQIDEIDGLHMLRSLRVLMLGKNRIKKIESLQSLTKLDVLDLHGNQIRQIDNLSHLNELRVLNLAGNEISHVDNLSGMDALAELNLRRNRIKTVTDVDNLPCLQRLFLSFNEIDSYDSISCLGFSSSLSEVSLDGNPLSNENNYKQIILKHLQQLRLLDMKRVSEEERRMAMVLSRKEDEKKREQNKAAVLKEKRRLAINNAQRHWEASHSKSLSRSGRRGSGKMPDIRASHVATVDNTHLPLDEDTDSLSAGGSRPSTSRSARTVLTSVKFERPRSAKTENKEPVVLSSLGNASSMSHLAELDSDTLNLYGPGSLEALDRNWGIQAAGTVTTICFSFIPFDELARHLYKIRARFPSVTAIKFYAASIGSLHQLNALAGLRRLEHIVIDQNGNPVTRFHLWKYYLLYRLAHFNLKKINEIEVLAIDVMNADAIFRPMAGVIAASLPHSRLFSLLSENRRKQLLSSEEKMAKSLEMKLSESRSSESVTKAALSYVPAPSDHTPSKSQSSASSRRDFARCYIKELKRDAAHVNVKRTELQTVWPQVFMDMVRSAVCDMTADRNGGYMRTCLDNLERTTADSIG